MFSINTSEIPTNNTYTPTLFLSISEEIKDFIWSNCQSSQDEQTVATTAADEDNMLAIVLPSAIGSILLVIACAGVLVLLILVVHKRRTYYDPDVEQNIRLSRSAEFAYREINHHDLKIGKLLGQGAFGKVYKVCLHSVDNCAFKCVCLMSSLFSFSKGEYHGATVAIKIFDDVRLDEAEENTLLELRKEAHLMEKLSNHPNIVHFVGAVTKGSPSDVLLRDGGNNNNLLIS